MHQLSTAGEVREGDYVPGLGRIVSASDRVGHVTRLCVDDYGLACVELDRDCPVWVDRRKPASA